MVHFNPKDCVFLLFIISENPSGVLLLLKAVKRSAWIKNESQESIAVLRAKDEGPLSDARLWNSRGCKKLPNRCLSFQVFQQTPLGRFLPSRLEKNATKRSQEMPPFLPLPRYFVCYSPPKNQPKLWHSPGHPDIFSREEGFPPLGRLSIHRLCVGHAERGLGPPFGTCALWQGYSLMVRWNASFYFSIFALRSHFQGKL